ncbi:hypothetical protein GXP70_07910 [Paenibacillus lycopersici]|uniref:Uncharacterized protein n=1 Tax=Paenibacillus lycopersici TaxID=2704462 RepID=A0A6C0FV20_9BACL|nr:hypothetical protein [Paenibacillus lycopersici]QHT59882.1 hypothetical protein GXP70_07910 [Paenibacillus lycopersici]
MEVAFGKPILNTARAELFKSALIDHEQVIKDVCIDCNSKLSIYDDAGKILALEINKTYSPPDSILSVNKNMIGWIYKTHLNHLRIIADRETGEYYKVIPRIYKSLIKNSQIPQYSFPLYFQGWNGLSYFWDINDERKIPYFSYRSVRYPDIDIIISNFRIKWLDTFMVFPRNLNYLDFERRLSETLKTIKHQFRIAPDLHTPFSNLIVFKNLLTTNEILENIRKID